MHCLHLLPVWAKNVKSTVPISQVSEQNSLGPGPELADRKEAWPCFKVCQGRVVTSNNRFETKEFDLGDLALSHQKRRGAMSSKEGRVSPGGAGKGPVTGQVGSLLLS